MTELYDDLIRIADKLESISEGAASTNALEPLKKLEECAELVGKAWSGSWLGYHANVYYSHLGSPSCGCALQPGVGIDGRLAIERYQRKLGRI